MGNMLREFFPWRRLAQSWRVGQIAFIGPARPCGQSQLAGSGSGSPLAPAATCSAAPPTSTATTPPATSSSWSSGVSSGWPRVFAGEQCTPHYESPPGVANYQRRNDVLLLSRQLRVVLGVHAGADGRRTVEPDGPLARAIERHRGAA